MNNNFVKDSIVGFAVGDALGVPCEFCSRSELAYSPVTCMEEYGTHHQPKGTWSDDTSLMLALMDALCDGEYDLLKIAENFVAWYDKDKYTPHGSVFDIGNSTADAIRKIKRGISPLHTGGSDFRENGNGGLMRILPAAFYLYYEDDINKRAQCVYEICGITHNHIISKAASHIYTELAIKLVENKNIAEAYMEVCTDMNAYYKDKLDDKEKHLFSSILSGNIQSRTIDTIKSSGYVIDTLEAVLWCLLTTDNYKDAVLRAVNLGDDTDTIGALTGGLAGLVYGIQDIPEQWVHDLVKGDYIMDMAQNLYLKLFGSKDKRQ